MQVQCPCPWHAELVQRLDLYCLLQVTRDGIAGSHISDEEWNAGTRPFARCAAYLKYCHDHGVVPDEALLLSAKRRRLDANAAVAARLAAEAEAEARAQAQAQVAAPPPPPSPATTMPDSEPESPSPAPTIPGSPPQAATSSIHPAAPQPQSLPQTPPQVAQITDSDPLLGIMNYYHSDVLGLDNVAVADTDSRPPPQSPLIVPAEQLEPTDTQLQRLIR